VRAVQREVDGALGKQAGALPALHCHELGQEAQGGRMITGEQIDRAAQAVLDEQADNRAVFTDDHPQADKADDEYHRHLAACEGCQMAEAVEASLHCEAISKLLVWQQATGEMTLAEVTANALSYGLRVGLRVARLRDETRERHVEMEAL
jgi:hypothetical protein